MLFAPCRFKSQLVVYILLVLTILSSAIRAHAFVATTTALAITAAGSPVTTVNVGTAVTFTATVTVAGAPITTGQVTFCDADAAFCNDIHRIGTAQVLANGTATLNAYLPSGAHHYKALTTVAGATSSSPAVPLTVTPSSLTPTTTVVTGTTNGTLTATINHVGNPFPHTGTVTFTDTDTSSTLGTIPLAGTPTAIQYPVAGGGFSSTTGFLYNNDIPILLLPADFNNDGRPDLLVTFAQGAQSTTNGTFPSSVVQISQPGSPNTPISKPIALPSGCKSAALADFNHDGNLDIAAFITGGSAPSVLTGNGDGTYSTPLLSQAPPAARSSPATSTSTACPISPSSPAARSLSGREPATAPSPSALPSRSSAQRPSSYRSATSTATASRTS